MQTIRTISNISYNTIDHFEGVVFDLLRRGIIEWCYWILHQPDTDETKEHIHFVLKPSRRLDTTDLRKEFMEIDKTHPLPLCCTTKWNFTNSLDDWLLYVVHDVAYLMSKGQFRNIQYKFEDLRATDMDALRNDWNAVDITKYQRLYYLQKAVDDKVPFAVLVQQGVVPISQRAQYEAQYNGLIRLRYMDLDDGGRIRPHEEVVLTEMDHFIPDDKIEFGEEPPKKEG